MTDSNGTLAIQEGSFRVVIAASFTAEPIRDALEFWMSELGFEATFAFAPFNQILQQLLDPASLLSDNTGVNIIYARLSDWDAPVAEIAGAPQQLLETIDSFVQALDACVARARAPHLVILCPENRACAAAQSYDLIEQELKLRLDRIAGVSIVTSSELQRLYPLDSYYDPFGERLARMPFSDEGYAAIATMTARRIYSLRSAHAKVIAVDCDNTLWQGVVGEDGADAIILAARHLQLQEFLLEQKAKGMLLCLCSKNNESDVWEVFDRRKEMAVKRDDFVAWRINWDAKSDNLRSLAEELCLGIESFILIDDSPAEIAEVESRCDGVMTVELPESAEDARGFLDHVWAFDKEGVSEEGSRRTQMYQEERRREDLKKRMPSLDDFIKELGVEINIRKATERDIRRIWEIGQRTNQMNTSVRRKAEADIRRDVLTETDKQCEVVEVRDRYGDYGLVGVMVYAEADDSIVVEELMLSCRVLGRSVEKEMLKRLGEVGIKKDKRKVEVEYRQTERNNVARKMLEGSGHRSVRMIDSSVLYVFSVEALCGLEALRCPAQSAPAIN